MSLIQKEIADFTVQSYQNNAFRDVSKADVLGIFPHRLSNLSNGDISSGKGRKLDIDFAGVHAMVTSYLAYYEFIIRSLSIAHPLRPVNTEHELNFHNTFLQYILRCDTLQ